MLRYCLTTVQDTPFEWETKPKFILVAAAEHLMNSHKIDLYSVYSFLIDIEKHCGK